MAPSSVPDKGRPTQTRSNIASLGTIDYHESLLNQNRQLGADELEHEIVAPKNARRWINKRPNTSGSGRGTGKSSRKNPAKNEAVTRQDLEEFKALPIAVRRKYFSTLERLRFAQTSGNLDGNTDIQFTRSITLSGGEALQSRDTIGQRSFASPTRTVPSPTSPVYQTVSHSPARLHHNCLTREEQVALARSLRESVILDAADEAIYKIGRRSSKQLMPQVPSQTPSSIRPSMEREKPAAAKTQKAGIIDDAFYDSFRWMDEDEDLDLRLYVDDYHANLRETLPMPAKDHRPSFRRHLSITKIPFGRPSVSSIRPATKDSMSTPGSPTPNSATHTPHARRTSRALSLIGPRHVAQGSTASMQDPATHYQDPEARLKLRVYLASPQKFDEAIEFGFPSNDVLSGKSNQVQRQSHHQPRMLSDDSTGLETFLSDDRSSTCSEDMSMPDSDSPKTPHSPERHGVKPRGISEDEGTHSTRAKESYAQAPASSREMTLRMTLTRPDLRACEEHIYGWQKGLHPQAGASTHASPIGDDLPAPASYFGDNKPKQSLDQFFASLDEAAPSVTDGGGMVKRLWNRVRRN